jgi:hypothetical protein
LKEGVLAIPMTAREESHQHADCECYSCAFGPEAGERHFAELIRRAGFAVNFIFNASPPFAYSTGLTETFNVPEFIVVGAFGPEMVQTISAGLHRLAEQTPAALRTAAREVTGVAQIRLPDGSIEDVPFGFAPLAPEHLLPEAALPVTKTLERYGPGGFEMRQVVVPDPGGKLPWHAGHDAAWSERAEQVALYRDAPTAEIDSP